MSINNWNVRVYGLLCLGVYNIELMVRVRIWLRSGSRVALAKGENTTD